MGVDNKGIKERRRLFVEVDVVGKVSIGLKTNSVSCFWKDNSLQLSSFALKGAMTHAEIKVILSSFGWELLLREAYKPHAAARRDDVRLVLNSLKLASFGMVFSTSFKAGIVIK